MPKAVRLNVGAVRLTAYGKGLTPEAISKCLPFFPKYDFPMLLSQGDAEALAHFLGVPLPYIVHPGEASVIPCAATPPRAEDERPESISSKGSPAPYSLTDPRRATSRAADADKDSAT